jgi:hypothetical protein
MSAAEVNGERAPDEVLGELRDSSALLDDGPALQAAIGADGYLFVRSAVDPALVMTARSQVLARLAEVEEISDPAGEGIFTGQSTRRERHADLGAFWRSVSETPSLRRVTHGPELRGLLGQVLEEPARPHDFLFLRVGTPGKATGLHYDMPFFCRGSKRVHTVWIALGEVALDQGPLMVVEGSHRFDDLIEPIRRIDYDSPSSGRVSFPQDAITLARTRGTRLLTAHFQPGDVVVFGMTLMHGALDHHCPRNRVRLSCDIRFQPEADSTDPRYFGPEPTGTTGAGYAELNGAKPLTDPWHSR